MTFRFAFVVGASLAVLACSSPDTGGGSSAPPKAASAIKHLVVVIQENTSFDAYYGRWCTAPTGSNPTCNDGPACCEAGPDTDPGSGNAPITLDDASHGAHDPTHNAACFTKEINGGKMDGFVTADCGAPENFAYADAGLVKPYRDLASKSALADHWFQPVVGSSSANDMYFARASFVFEDNTETPDSIAADCGLHGTLTSHDDPTVGDLLSDAGVPWAFYIQGYKASLDAVAQGFCPTADPECPGGINVYPCVYDPGDIPFQYYPRFRDDPAIMKDYTSLATALQDGTLPAVSFVKAIGFRTEHPGVKDTISDGVKFVTDLVAEVEGSSVADSTLILFTYDESGGYFDHVPPPPDSAVDGKAYGPRVPTMAIGPFAKTGFVSHVVLEHSSVVKFIEWNWLGEQTGQLNTRDAVVDNIGSLLDPGKTGVAVPE